jgi:glycosyltransferase involved in cell wall biosynthesis
MFFKLLLQSPEMKIALVTPHLYMWDKLLKKSIFAPGTLAINLANELIKKDHKVSLFTTGPVPTKAKVVPLDLSEEKKILRPYNYQISELIKHDLKKFKKLFRETEHKILISAFQKAQQFDVIHVFITSVILGPQLAKKCITPTIFTVHDPFKFHFSQSQINNTLQKVYFTAISNSQKKLLPQITFKSTIHHGIDLNKFSFHKQHKNYFVSYGRIITPKGVHHAVNVCRKTHNQLKIGGLHYEGHGGDHYWSKKILPFVDNKLIRYEGFLTKQKDKNILLGNAKALLFPIDWEEPFGLTMVEANACGTPVIAFNRGSVPEIIRNGINGFIVNDEKEMIEVMEKINKIDRRECRLYVEKFFPLDKMVSQYERLYYSLLHKNLY